MTPQQEVIFSPVYGAVVMNETADKQQPIIGIIVNEIYVAGVIIPVIFTCT